MIHTGDAFDLVGSNAILESLSALVLKWPVTQKWPVAERRGLKFGIAGRYQIQQDI